MMHNDPSSSATDPATDPGAPSAPGQEAAAQSQDTAPAPAAPQEATPDGQGQGQGQAQPGDAAGADSAEDPAARIAALEAEVRSLKETYLRALAEAENAKRMADKRIEDNSKYAVSNFAKAVLSVADNLGRALLAAPESARQDNEALRNLAIGVEMTARELDQALGKYQVKRVEALNAAFDPNLHQAVQEMENTAVPTGTVVQVLQDGYTIHDRLLRPAMVVVSRGGPKRAPKPAGDGGEGSDGPVAPGTDSIDTTV